MSKGKAGRNRKAKPCPVPGKPKYATWKEAHSTNVALVPYQCCCGWWHLTTGADRRKNKYNRNQGLTGEIYGQFEKNRKRGRSRKKK